MLSLYVCGVSQGLVGGASARGTLQIHDELGLHYCSTGIPILKIIFNNSPQLSSISLPLLVYHPTQILLGSTLVPWLQQWVSGNGGQSILPSTVSATSSRTNSPNSDDA